jgi:hypothetical protein
MFMQLTGREGEGVSLQFVESFIAPNGFHCTGKMLDHLRKDPGGGQFVHKPEAQAMANPSLAPQACVGSSLLSTGEYPA